MGIRASPLSGYLLLYTQFLSRCVTQGSKFRICISSCWLVLSHGHSNYNLEKTEFRKDVLRKPPLPPFYHLPQLENSVILKWTFFSFLQLPHSFLLAPFYSFLPSTHLTCSTPLPHLLGSQLVPILHPQSSLLPMCKCYHCCEALSFPPQLLAAVFEHHTSVSLDSLSAF